LIHTIYSMIILREEVSSEGESKSGRRAHVLAQDAG
jgi:hypothetical protein